MREVVLSHKIERDEFLAGKYVPREGLQKGVRNSLIKVIVGPRRAGKSVFCIQMLEQTDFAYLNFDDERLVGISDYDELLKAVRRSDHLLTLVEIVDRSMRDQRNQSIHVSKGLD